MQAFAISVVLMSSACGQGDPAAPLHCTPYASAVVCHFDGAAPPAAHVVSFNSERYDSGKGHRYVSHLSRRRNPVSSQR
jgi:hypothetical protein